MSKVRIVFQGDSITDAGRDRRNYFHLGNGYPKYSAENLRAALPDVDFEFIDLGISGNRSCQLFDRIYTDCIALEPDIVSVLIGINDIWHRYGGGKIATTDEQFAANYRAILSRIKSETSAKLAVFLPFLLDAPDKAHFRPDLDRLLPIASSIAAEYADVVVDLDTLFAEAMKTQPEPLYFSGDGVHPNENGSRFIAKHYAEVVAPLITK